MKNSIFKLLIITSLLVVSCKGKRGEEGVEKMLDQEKMEQTDGKGTPLFDVAQLSEEPLFEIKTNLGSITIKLYKETPLHRDNFVKLASEGFYNGIKFHRIIKGFMIQVGDPLTKDMDNEARFGTGGPGYNVDAEILSQFTHKKGAVAAARQGDHVNPERASSGSQFYIVENPEACSHLDGQYTIFGETIEGIEVIDKIAAVEVNQRDRPIEHVVIESVLPVEKYREGYNLY